MEGGFFHTLKYFLLYWFLSFFCFQQHSECIPCPRYCMRLGGSKMKHGLDTQEIRNLIFKNKKVREVSLAQKSESVSHSVVSDSATPGTVCSLPSSSVHWILQARILEWAAIPFSRGSFQLRDWTQVSHIAGGFFIIWVIREELIFNFFLGVIGRSQCNGKSNEPDI